MSARLHRAVRIVELSGDALGWALEDPVIGVRLKLDAVGMRIARALDGNRNPSQIADAASVPGAPRVAPGLVARLLALFDEAGVLDGPRAQAAHAAGAAARTRLALPLPGTRTVRGPPLEVRDVRVLEGARFSCQGTGLCCSGYTPGPIEDAVVEAVRAHQFRGNPELLNAGVDPFVEVPDPGMPGRTVRVLRAVQSRCVFLSEARRCLIHEELGAHIKPAICRTYPLRLTVAPDGDCYVSLNMECGGYHGAARTHGALLAERAETLRELAATLPFLRPLPDPLPLARGVEVSWARYQRLDAAWLLGLRGRAEPASGHLRHLCRQLVAFLAGDDAPAMGTPHPEGTPVVAAPARAHVETAARLVEAFAGEVAASQGAAGESSRAQLFERVRAAAAAVAAGGAPAPGPGPHNRSDADVHALFLDQLEQAVFGKWLSACGTVMDGLGAHALRLALAGAAADGIARAAGAPCVAAFHASEGLRTVNRALRDDVVRMLFAGQESLLAAIVESTAA